MNLTSSPLMKESKKREHGWPAEVEFYPSGPHLVTIDEPFRLEIINVYVRRKGKMGSPSTKLVVIVSTSKEGAFITLALICPPGENTTRSSGGGSGSFSTSD